MDKNALSNLDDVTISPWNKVGGNSNRVSDACRDSAWNWLQIIQTNIYIREK